MSILECGGREYSRVDFEGFRFNGSSQIKDWACPTMGFDMWNKGILKFGSDRLGLAPWVLVLVKKDCEIAINVGDLILKYGDEYMAVPKDFAERFLRDQGAVEGLSTYVSRPVKVEAFQYTGKNLEDLKNYSRFNIFVVKSTDHKNMVEIILSGQSIFVKAGEFIIFEKVGNSLLIEVMSSSRFHSIYMELKGPTPTYYKNVD